MKNEDLKKLSKEQLENILFESYNRMNSKAQKNQEAAKKIGIMEDPGYFSYAAALKTECNRLDIIIKMELQNE